MHFWGPRQCYVRCLFLFLISLLDFFEYHLNEKKNKTPSREGKGFVSDV